MRGAARGCGFWGRAGCPPSSTREWAYSTCNGPRVPKWAPSTLKDLPRVALTPSELPSTSKGQQRPPRGLSLGEAILLFHQAARRV